jgi:hypothetical protein
MTDNDSPYIALIVYTKIIFPNFRKKFKKIARKDFCTHPIFKTYGGTRLRYNDRTVLYYALGPGQTVIVQDLRAGGGAESSDDEDDDVSAQQAVRRKRCLFVFRMNGVF